MSKKSFYEIEINAMLEYLANSKEDRRKTSVSLPEDQFKALENAHMKTGVSIHELGLLCLKRLVYSNQITEMSDGFVCQYNRAHCPKKIFPYMTATEHNSMKCIRIMKHISVSFLFSQGIEEHLEMLTEYLMAMQYERARNRMIYYFLFLKTWFQDIHRRISICLPRTSGFSIVMTRGHNSDPFPPVWGPLLD